MFGLGFCSLLLRYAAVFGPLLALSGEVEGERGNHLPPRIALLAHDLLPLPTFRQHARAV